MSGGVWQFKQDHCEYWAYWQDAFNADECQKIIKLGESKTFKKGTIGKTNEGVESNRKSDIVFLYPSDDLWWVFERISTIVMNLNERFFKFDLLGMAEGLQFTRYRSPGEFYGKHVDNALNFPIRKLSFTLQLSNPETYEGGELCLFTSVKPITIERKQGYVAVFPSWTLHEVKPVTKGTRYSLVSWVTGPAFR